MGVDGGGSWVALREGDRVTVRTRLMEGEGELTGTVWDDGSGKLLLFGIPLSVWQEASVDRFLELHKNALEEEEPPVFLQIPRDALGRMEAQIFYPGHLRLIGERWMAVNPEGSSVWFAYWNAGPSPEDDTTDTYCRVGSGETAREALSNGDFNLSTGRE